MGTQMDPSVGFDEKKWSRRKHKFATFTRRASKNAKNGPNWYNQCDHSIRNKQFIVN